MLKNNNEILQETKKNPLYSSNMCSQFLFLPSFLFTSFLMPEAPYFRHKYLGATDSILNALVITQTTYTHDLKIKFGRKCTYAKKIAFFNLLKNSFHIFRLYGILVFTNAIYTVLCRHLESRTYMISL